MFEKIVFIVAFYIVMPMSLLAQLIIDNKVVNTPLSICNLQNDAVTYYMQNAYLDGDGAKYYDTEAENSLMNSIIQKYDDGTSKHEWTQWPRPIQFNTADGSKLLISTDSTFTYNVTKQNISGNITDVYNLVPGQIYYYSIENSKNQILSSGKFATQGRIRMIKMDATYNVRDLGGHLCYDSEGNVTGITRYNLLYRSAMPQTADSEIAKILNIKSQISVCYEKEMSSTNPWNLDTVYCGNDTYRLSDDNGFFAERATTQHIATVLKQIINNLSADTVLPTLYNCSAGADRTGGLSLILLGLCGVTEDEIIHDYEMTSLAPFFISNDDYQRTGHRLVTDKYRIGMMFQKLNEITPEGTLKERIIYYLTSYLKSKKVTRLTTNEITTLQNLLIEPIKQITDGTEQELRLTVTPFCITPGAEKGGADGYLGISIERGDALGITALSCDIELPTGLSLSENTSITIDKQSMPLCKDGGNASHLYNISTAVNDAQQTIHLECSHRSGLCFEDNQQLTFHLNLVADNTVEDKLSEIKLTNVIVTCPDMSRLKLADNRASVIIGEPALDNLELIGNYANYTIEDFNSVLINQKQLNTVDLRNIESTDTTTVWKTGNPNTLFYLQSQMDIANTINVVKDGVCDNFVLTDMYSFNKLDEELVAENATYTRNTDAKWCTVCLPFAISSTDSVQLYTCQNIDEGTILLKKIESAEAGEAVIMSNKSSQSNYQFLSTNVTIANECHESIYEDIAMLGTFEEKIIEEQDIYYIANNEFWNNQSYTITIPAYRAWIVPTNPVEMQSNLRAAINEDDVTKLDVIKENDIETIECFNIMGQKVNTNKNGILLIKQNDGSMKKVLIH